VTYSNFNATPAGGWIHSLRHTAATILASSATPPGTVHRILGHASFATTVKLYGGLTAEALENAARARLRMPSSRDRTKTRQTVQRESRNGG
jgi:integrase